MGAVIRMRGTIPTRRALLDIGASGPLAGLFFAPIPLYSWGIAALEGRPAGGAETTRARRVAPHRAAWTALFGPDARGYDARVLAGGVRGLGRLLRHDVNLLPVGQLDGGHVAYALFGRGKTGRGHRSPLDARVLLRQPRELPVSRPRAGHGLYRIGTHINNSLFWLVWFEMLAVLGALSSRARGPAAARARGHLDSYPRARHGRARRLRGGCTRAPAAIVGISWFLGLGLLLAMEAQSGVLRKHSHLDHPPAGDEPLDPVRKAIAVVTLAFFMLLFMPTPIEM